MRYLRFTISNYRAITGPLVIDLSKRSLIPIIGINESGKTTVLHALFAFDFYNDDLNEDGRHLRDTANLYRTSPPTPTVAATILCTKRDLFKAFTEVDRVKESAKSTTAIWRKKRQLPDNYEIEIVRNLKSREYNITVPPFVIPTSLHDTLARAILAQLPYILFFDDFRDRVDERIEIPSAEPTTLSGWLAIMEQLFHQADSSLSVFQLGDMEVRQRKSTLAKVQRYLNNTLTKEWQNFRLDDRDALEIGLEFIQESDRSYLKLEVVERDANGDNHYFFVSDRSKGFFWFFNFVMKLEFNPKIVSQTDQTSIYLLDEPGSYLHASAQTKLCQKLRSLSERNKVIYCTHSHYLLDPEVIPLSNIVVADKDGNGSITLVPIHEHKGSILERRSAFQPVIDALRIKPFLLDMTHDRVVVVEGIYDYYTLELFRQNRPISILPSVGADSIKFYVSLLIAWQLRFWALWDNDEKGKKRFKEASELFGEEIASRCFRLLPTPVDGGTRIIQNLFDGEDLRSLRRELELPLTTSFEKTIAALFYSPRRAELNNMIGAKTRQNFENLWKHLNLE